MAFEARLKAELAALEEKGLHRSLRGLDGAQGRVVRIGGRDCINFCSNDYLGLAADVRLWDAAAASFERSGFGAGASRLVCGTMPEHRRLEERLAAFKGAEGCVLFNCGYMANVGIISSLFGRDDLILSDRLNHASIMDGIVLSRAEFRRYPHCDTAALEHLLREAGGQYRTIVIITESVFSMDGDLAPLDRIARLAKEHGAVVMVDEAHAAGVFGAGGRGAVDHFGCGGDIALQMGTLSKAFGSAGAYVCGPALTMDYIINRARSFIYTTALPPSVAAASLKALEIIESEPGRREALWRNARQVRDELRDAGFNTLRSQSPIIPVVIGDEKRAAAFSEKLFEQGLWVAAIRPPTVPANTARLRVTVTAGHTPEDVTCLLTRMKTIGKELCLI
ncbi:MAG TPA: 8-amino-7-oxononanoate synthase [Candidatus Omnitrophota bacterium]|nr:8-amino-7-oxononanoate synthase [Candidatus Omnitrophota bacterium]HQP11464.1 8-amino-7-oxononanoate synthase [Candidatus Omnitrophota bacterium]